MTGFVTSASGKSTILKDPQAVLDYIFDFTEWLDDIADTISARTVTVETGIVKNSDSIATGNKKVIVWLSGGATVGIAYKITCHITTAAGREDERSFYVKIKDK